MELNNEDEKILENGGGPITDEVKKIIKFTFDEHMWDMLPEIQAHS